MDCSNAQRLFNWLLPVLCSAIIILAQAVALLALGRPMLCTCGTIRLWIGTLSSPELSQQISDWYTFMHLIHGMGFYALLWIAAPRLPIVWRLVLAIGLEAGWEVTENTPFIISRYRMGAIAQGYFGDSVINSLSDTAVGILGFLLAWLLPAWLTSLVAVAIEGSLAILIHDNLTLNILHLLFP